MLGQLDVVPYVLPEPRQSVLPDDEPQFQSPKPPAQRDAPVTVIDGFVRVGVLEVQRIDDQGGGQPHPAPNPQTRTVKVHQQPLVGIRVEGVRVLDAGQVLLQLRTYERVAGVRRVHVQPHARLGLANRPDLLQIVERTTGRRAQDRRHEERYQAVLLVLFHRVLQRVPVQAAVLVRLEYSYLHQEDLGRLFDARVRLLGTIADEFGQEGAVLHFGAVGFEVLDGLVAGGQHAHQHALAGRCLDDAASGAAVGGCDEVVGQADSFTQPIHYDGFQFCACGTCGL